MTMMTEGTTYLTVRRLSRYPYGIQVVKATDKKPKVVPTGAVVVKVQLRMPRAAFVPLEPEAVVTIPEELVQHVVSVEAVASDG